MSRQPHSNRRTKYKKADAGGAGGAGFKINSSTKRSKFPEFALSIGLTFAICLFGFAISALAEIQSWDIAKNPQASSEQSGNSGDSKPAADQNSSGEHVPGGESVPASGPESQPAAEQESLPADETLVQPSAPRGDLSWVDPNRPVVALTFDDGPAINTTSPELYDYLEKYNISSTFFWLGKNAEWQPEAVPRVYASGSQIANHSYDHPDLTTLSPGDVAWQQQHTDEILRSIGVKEDRILFRLPGGAYSDEVASIISAPLMQWSCDTLDWRHQTPQEIVDNMPQVYDGDIILMHEIHQKSVDAVKIIVPMLQEQGFQFLTLDEMYAYKGIALENGHLYNYAH